MSLRFQVVLAGKIREKYLQDAVAEYKKRLGGFGKAEIVSVADESLPDRLSAAEAALIKAREGERLLKAIDPGAVVVALDLQGKQLTSEEFAAFIAERALGGQGSFSFVIGGSLGLAPAVLERADLSLCLGRMTLPHQMVPLIVLEQVFRACKINAGQMYHR